MEVVLHSVLKIKQLKFHFVEVITSLKFGARKDCSYRESIRSQGAGTQTGSTRDLGEGTGRYGFPDQFGLGATSKYSQDCDSGGGGGGGWYGGRSGGYGYNSFKSMKLFN